MKYSVFLGRFQPVHFAHLNIIKTALEMTDRLILVIGSHNKPASIRNPFTSEDRRNMILSSCEELGLDCSRIAFAFIPDYTYNDNRWITAVTDSVNAIVMNTWTPDPIEINLIGHRKDNTSFYLGFFPTWKSIDVPVYKNINATEIRDSILEFGVDEVDLAHDTTKAVISYLKDWSETPTGIQMHQEFVINKKYKEAWKAAPFPPTFNTVDAVVVKSGHVLMVTRGAAPGKGLLALPGGFLDQNETLIEGAIRELKEETKIDVPVPVLMGSIAARHTFDDPNRSSRGRTITQAFLFDLGQKGKLPKVKGSDDAVKAEWIPLANLDTSKVFEDHASIIQYFTGF